MVGLTNRQPKAEQADNRMKCYYHIDTRYTLTYTTLQMAMAERNTIFFEMFDSDTVFLLPWQNMTNYLGGLSTDCRIHPDLNRKGRYEIFHRLHNEFHQTGTHLLPLFQ